MQSCFETLEDQVPRPTDEQWGEGWRTRYLEQTLEQALILKLARQLSALAALDILISRGFISEQGALQRIIDEASEDVIFLALSVCNGAHSDLHDEFLAAFWMEDFTDPADPVGSATTRPMVARKRIRAFNNRAQGQKNPSHADAVGRSLYSVYSGFIHGAATQISELFDHRTRRLRLSGLTDHDRYFDYVHDAQNYFYRGLLSVAITAKALGSVEVLTSVSTATKAFVEAIGIEELEKEI